MANFLSNTLQKSGCEISPLEIELLFIFDKYKKLTSDEILKSNDNIKKEFVDKLLNHMKKNSWIKKGSPYELDKRGIELFNQCKKLQAETEPIIENNVFYNRLYKVSSVSIKP